MKTLFLTDIHNHDKDSCIDSIKDIISKENPKKLVFLGDVDIPEILEEILSLDIEKKVLIGNHDYNWARKDFVCSKLLKFDSQYYQEQWQKNPYARDFVLDNSQEVIPKPKRKKGLKIIEKVNGYKFIYVHGNIINDDRLSLIWDRLYDDELKTGRLSDTFRTMQKRNYDILIRGHDHVSSVFSINKRQDPYKHDPVELANTFELSKENRYIINLGAFFQGVYGLLEDKLFTITHK